MTDVSPPRCRWGYPESQLKEELTKQEYRRLMEWLHGQTMAVCTGLVYNHETRSYEKGCETPHKRVVYPHDFERWKAALPIID